MTDALKYDPFPLIFAAGDAMAQVVCLDLFGLASIAPARRLVDRLAQLQRPDGGFPSQFDSRQWGMLETVRHLLLFLRTGLPPGDERVSRAVHLIASHQRPDGGWCENPLLLLPPDRTWLSNRRSITWLTADVVDLLRLVGMGESVACRRAMDWLRSEQNPDSGWHSLAADSSADRVGTGDPDATAGITFLMAEMLGETDPVYLKGRARFEHHLDLCARDARQGHWLHWLSGEKQQLDVYTLTHLLLSWLFDPPRRIRAGYDVRDERVRQTMEVLAGIQRPDGGWRPFWLPGSDPAYTALAVKVLVLTGAITREGQADRVARHAGQPVSMNEADAGKV